MEKLKAHFEATDIDADGMMTRDEFEGRLPELISMFREQDFHFSDSDLNTIFELVDFDKDGVVEVNEFLGGMSSFTSNVSDMPVQFLKFQSNISLHLAKMQDKFFARFDSLEQMQRNLDAKLNAVALKSEPVAPSGPLPRFGICC